MSSYFGVFDNVWILTSRQPHRVNTGQDPNTDEGSNLWCGKGFFSQSTSVTDCFGVCTALRILQILSAGSHTIVWTHKILHTLAGLGSTALEAAVPYPVEAVTWISQWGQWSTKDFNNLESPETIRRRQCPEQSLVWICHVQVKAFFSCKSSPKCNTSVRPCKLNARKCSHLISGIRKRPASVNQALEILDLSMQEFLTCQSRNSWLVNLKIRISGTPEASFNYRRKLECSEHQIWQL